MTLSAVQAQLQQTQDVPNWVLLSLLSLTFTICIGLFVWIVNRIINQADDNQKQNNENFRRLTDAISSIERTTIVQTEILKTHADDIKAHDIMLESLKSATRTRK